MAFGLSSTGFDIKRVSDIKTEIEESLRAELGNFINILPPSVFATLIGIVAEREASVWELAEDVYNSQYPDTAEGVQLDNVVALTGITRLAATKSVVIGQLLFGTAGTVVPLGTVLSVDGNSAARFLTDAAVTLVTGTDEVQEVTFSAVPTSGTWRLQWYDEETSVLAFNANAAAVQAALNALPGLSGITVTGNYTIGFTITFAGDDGKQDQILLVVSANSLLNGVTAIITTMATLTPGVNQGSVDLTAESVGAVQAPARTLTVIETPVVGLDRTKNQLDAEIGRETETDLKLRQRRQETIQVAGAGTVEAIRARLLNLDGVTAVIVFENTAEVEINGRPPKSYECVVQGGDDQVIADEIWESKPAGIATFGSEDSIVIDSQGFSQDIHWSRPTDLDIWLEVDLTTDANFPLNGLVLTEAALVAAGNAFGIGKDVVVFPTLLCSLHEIPGIVDVEIRIGTAASPTLDDNIEVDPNEIAVFDTSRTTVIEL